MVPNTNHVRFFRIRNLNIGIDSNGTCSYNVVISNHSLKNRKSQCWNAFNATATVVVGPQNAAEFCH